MKSVLARLNSLSVKFLLVITAIVASVGFTIGGAVIIQDWFRFQNSLEEKSLLLAHSIALTAPEAILQNDTWYLHKVLRKIALQSPGRLQDTRILSGMVLSPTGLVLAHIDPANNPVGLRLSPASDLDKKIFTESLRLSTAKVFHSGSIFNDPFVEGVVPVYSDLKKIGVVRLRLSTVALYAQARRSALTVLAITSGLVLIGSLFGALFSRRLIKPLTVLANGMQSIGRGDIPDLSGVNTEKKDEIGQLAKSFKWMSGQLQDKKLLEEEMAINEKMIALGRISAGVAHEVNNPLAGILNCLDTLKKHPEDRELVNRYLPIIEKGLHRIRQIVASLLGELRVESEQDFAGPSCLDDLWELALLEIDNSQIELNWDNRLDPDVVLNKHRVQQIVLNLLKNAFQVVKGKGSVDFRAFRDGSCLVLEVQDDGPGISEESRARLFDPFFTTRSDGTGLGLWITYRMVRSLNGNIDVISELDKGTTVQVYLPAQQQKLEKQKDM